MSRPSGERLAHDLFVLLKTAAFYGADNEACRRSCEAALETLRAAGAAEGTLELEARGDDLYLDGRLVRFQVGSSAARGYLTWELARRGVARLRFSSALGAGDLSRFARLFLAAPAASGAGAPLAQALERAGLRGVQALGPEPGAPDITKEETPAQAAGRAFRLAEGVVREVLAQARDGRRLEFGPARRAVESLLERVTADPDALLDLALLRRFDRYTYTHCVNVSVYALAVGARLGLRRELQLELGFAALFHDVGKARLPLEIVDKPAALDEDERRQMQRHPALGALLLLAHRPPRDRGWARAVAVAFEHHLGLDGSGYPALRWARRPDLFTRICSIADGFDAMTSGRAYASGALTPCQAAARLREKAGSFYDPFLLELFEEALGERCSSTAGSER